MLTVLAALTLAAAPADEPALTPPQAEALRCAVAFAIGAKLQEERSPAAAAWPDLTTRGKEYFVRTTAKLMDDTKASRETLTAMVMRQMRALAAPEDTARAIPGCLPLLDASGS